jgi:hypothetical protein
VLHSLPGRIAAQRGHPQTHAIEVCSVLGLLLFPLWMFALIWAYAGTVGQPLPGADGDPPSVTVTASEPAERVASTEPAPSEPSGESPPSSAGEA